MSEQSNESGEFESTSPEAALQQFLRLTYRDGFDELSADGLYIDVVMRLDSLLESCGRAGFIPAVARLEEILPETYSRSGLDIKEWLQQLRLAPLRLLDRDIPEVELMSHDYAWKAIEGALHDSDHAAHHYDKPEDSEAQCTVSVICPVEATRSIALRQIALLVQSRYTYDPEDRFESELIDEIDRKVGVIRYTIASKYKIISPEECDDVLQMLHHENENLSVATILGHSEDNLE